MKMGINLASQGTLSGRRARKIFVVALLFFFLAVLCAVVLISYNFSLKSQVSRTQEETKRVRQNIDNIGSSKAKALAIKDRLSDIQKIKGTRDDINTKMDAIVSMLPPGAVIDDLETSEKEIVVKVKSANLAELNILLKQNIQEYALEQSNSVSRVDLSSFELDTLAGLYATTLTISFK